MHLLKALMACLLARQFASGDFERSEEMSDDQENQAANLEQFCCGQQDLGQERCTNSTTAMKGRGHDRAALGCSLRRPLLHVLSK